MADSTEAAKLALLTDLVKNLFNHYLALSQSIQQLPILDATKHHALYSIGSGYLWAKDAVESLQCNQLPIEPPNVD